MTQRLEKRLLDIDEASEYLGITKNTLYGMTSQRRIPFVKIGGKMLRFDVQDLDRWIEKKKIVPLEIADLLSNP